MDAAVENALKTDNLIDMTTIGSVIRFAPRPGILLGWTHRLLIQEDYAQDCRTQTPSRAHLAGHLPDQLRRYLDTPVAPARAPRRASRLGSCSARRTRRLSCRVAHPSPRPRSHCVLVPMRWSLSPSCADQLWADRSA